MQFEGIKQSGKTILMKVTSRQRPEILLNTIQKYVDLAANTKDMVWLFSFDEDDKLYDYDFNKRLFNIISKGELQSLNVFVFNKKSESKIHAINRDVDKFELHWDILLNISDDQVPVYQGYDDVIRRHMPDDLDASLWFNDGAQDRINTQEIIGRTYFERFKYIYNPIYKSFYCDNEATLVAKSLGKLIKNPRCLIKHDHFAVNKEIVKDDLYKKNDTFWKEDEHTFKQRQKENFK